MNKRILIIENNPEVAQQATSLMDSAGYKVYTADSGREGLEMAKKEYPALILCDTSVPELDGYGVLRALENFPELAGIPFILISSVENMEYFKKAMDMGADGFLTIPFEGDDLLRIVTARMKKWEFLKRKMDKYIDTTNEENDKLFQDISTVFAQGSIKKFRKKDFIYTEGETAKSFYFLVSGKVKVVKTNDSGKDYITSIYKEGDYFGYSSLLDDGIQKESAIGMENGELAIISKIDFLKLLSNNKSAAVQFLKKMSCDLSESAEKMLHLAYDSARKRVAEALVTLHQKYQKNDKDLSIPIHRENISALAGISPESVSRNLSDFKEEGLIETTNGSIFIPDPTRLANLKF